VGFMGPVKLEALDQPIRVYRTQAPTRIRRALHSLGLLPIAFGVWRTLRYWRPSRIARDRRLRREAPRNLPVPPGGLLLETGATRDVAWFLDSGAATAQSFRAALDRIGRPIESFRAVLDFGCGCGRVLRQWHDVRGPEFHGTDYNPRLIRWCKRNLDCARFSQNALAPPLEYADDSFDLCYAVSVFTHLPEAMQEAWLLELQRVLEPGGILLVTLSGEGDLIRTTPAEQERFRRGQLVVVDESYAGTNMCGAYHPEAYVREKWSRYFRILDFLPEGAKGSPRQDLYVLERL
jgi:SAM-dependent methyltransferase